MKTIGLLPTLERDWNIGEYRKMFTNDLEKMFATSDDLKNSRPSQMIDKARYYITAWLQSEWLKRFVFEIQSPLFTNKNLQELANIIESLAVNKINNEDLTYRVRQRLLNDIRQACNVCREK